MKINQAIELINKSTEAFLKTREKTIKGQFFTPPSIAQFMSQLCNIGKTNKLIRLLDPGAGTGVLTAYLCLELIKKNHLREIHADLYENDPKLVEILLKNMMALKRAISKKGLKFKFNIFQEDFIISNRDVWKDRSNTKDVAYDIAIANPPYFKLNKKDKLSVLMSEIVCGQPNIYSFFMATTAKLLSQNGQMIFITPRSYCSGLYFRAFRKWFFSTMKPTRIHIFESRKKAFNNEVLQETIILKAVKTHNRNKKVTISSSFDADFKTNYQELRAIPLETLISENDPEFFLKIPTSKQDLQVLEHIADWHNTLLTLGFRLSTGPVVDFRSTEFLNYKKAYDGKKTAPLFWMRNLNGFKVVWPAKKGNKAPSIIISNKSLNRLVKNKNYVFVKRFSAKEQQRRIYAAVYRKSDYKSDYIGIENHLNYIWKKNGESMTEEEAWGLMAFLSSDFIDKYFRIVSGSTQVNANEINNMPMPNDEYIIEMGKVIMKKKPKDLKTLATMQKYFAI